MRFFYNAPHRAAALQHAIVLFICLLGAKAGETARRAPPSVKQAPSAPAGVPDFVIKHAPLVYMDPKERYMPSDIGSFVRHTTPKLYNRAAIPSAPSGLTLDNLDRLNAFGEGGTKVFLTSKDDVKQNPPWLHGTVPDANGKTNGAVAAAVIVAEKQNGTLDAFYFYFNNFDYGGLVLGQNLGNHVGDWEYTMLRFQRGVPQAMWLSQHSGGKAYTFSAMMKDAAGLRPIVFSARGTHANYGNPGIHDRTNEAIPGTGWLGLDILADKTGYGALWDPIKSAYWYKFTAPTPATRNSSPTRKDSQIGTFKGYDGKMPLGWLYYQGSWGDQQYPKKDPKQRKVLGFAKYVTGPKGPAFKNLARNNVWPGSSGAISSALPPTKA